MKKEEKSCGVVPYIIKDNEPYFLLIKQNNGVVGFPKGHVEQGESEEETALRELFEETKAEVNLISGYKREIRYFMQEYDCYKTVVYFLGELKNIDFIKQDEEIKELYLKNYQDSLNLINYDDIRGVLIDARKCIK